MPIKSLRLQPGNRTAIAGRLSSALSERDHGLITQSEYEGRLSEIELSLGPHVVVEEAEKRGRTCFVIRNSVTCETVERFEFGRVWTADR